MTRGDRVEFRYRRSQWSWLPASRGRLGGYLPNWILQLADGQTATVRYTHGGHLSRYYFGEDEDWVFVRFDNHLGLSCYGELDPDKLRREGWRSQLPPSEFAVPASSLRLV